MIAASRIATNLDYERLFRLRLVVARYGEMDNAQWWNTKGQLGRIGSLALKRGLPATHGFAQARIVFAVAAHRCAEVFDLPGSVTLWQLPAEVEDRFEDCWQRWLDDIPQWTPFLSEVHGVQGRDGAGLLDVLTKFGLVSEDDLERAQHMRRSAEGRAVLVTGSEQLDDALVTALAAGFFRGEAGQPAVPYARLEG